MATQLMPDTQAVGQILFSSSATQLHKLGEKAVASDGRVYRYAKAGGADLVPGTLLQGPAEVTNHEALSPKADAAIGATQVTVTLGNTAVTADQYSGGWMIVTETPGQGSQYKIRSHPAANGSATLVLTLEDPLLVAITALASQVDLVMNPHSGVIINPASASASPVGVAVYPITSGQYGWIQVGGVATVLAGADGALTVGTNVVASNQTAGALEAATGVQASVGEAVTGVAQGDYGAVKLFLE